MRRPVLFVLEITLFSALVLTTRCANYRDVFAGGKIYFVDADCYARMTRARVCFEHPGTIIRHHDFENFPAGTSPHTTAPLDYLIAAIAAVLAPFLNHAAPGLAAANASTPLDLAGAIVSPLIAVALGIFLCWWTRRMAMRFRLALLVLYASSPILAHGTALGRPDHQSLLIALVTVALCADWMLLREPARCWSFLSGASWAMAIWVSLYEPLVLIGISAATCMAVKSRRRDERCGATVRQREKWLTFAAIVVIAAAVERRIPAVVAHPSFAALSGWSSTVGELSRVPLTSAVWFQWCSWLLLLSPILFWRGKPNGDAPLFVLALLVASFALAAIQARWAYFFVVLFALVAPEILRRIGKAAIAYCVFLIALFPVAQGWDETLSDERADARAETRIEQTELHAIATNIDGPLLAPWWFSPALSYWSGRPAVAGSSHESLAGIIGSARFYATTEASEAAQICRAHQVKWIVSYDAARLAENCERILGRPIAPDSLCYRLDRYPSTAPPFLKLVRQTARFKLYRIEDL